MLLPVDFGHFLNYKGDDHSREPGDYARRRRRRARRRGGKEEAREQCKKFEKVENMLDEAEGKQDDSENGKVDDGREVIENVFGMSYHSAQLTIVARGFTKTELTSK